MNTSLNTREIDEILNRFLAPFDCTAQLGTDFAYFPEDNLITYTFIVCDSFDLSYTQFIMDLFPNITADLFLWSFLHELGHHETGDDFDSADWHEYLMVINETKLSDEEYYNLPIERAATVWAGEYIQAHITEVASLWDELAGAIKRFLTSIDFTND